MKPSKPISLFVNTAAKQSVHDTPAESVHSAHQYRTHMIQSNRSSGINTPRVYESEANSAFSPQKTPADQSIYQSIAETQEQVEAILNRR